MAGTVAADLDGALSEFQTLSLATRSHEATTLSSASSAAMESSGIDRFDELMDEAAAKAPTHHLADINDCGSFAAYLVSDLAKSVSAISIEVGNILDWEGDAIINPAHTSLLAGSGLCGAIHLMAGPELEQAAKLLAPCPVGEVRLTPAFGLKCRTVIHAVGPRWWDGTRDEIELQARMYANIAATAEAHQLREIAIPAIGVGIHRFPILIAAEACLKSLARHSGVAQFRIILPNSELADAYSSVKFCSM